MLKEWWSEHRNVVPLHIALWIFNGTVRSRSEYGMELLPISHPAISKIETHIRSTISCLMGVEGCGAVHASLYYESAQFSLVDRLKMKKAGFSLHLHCMDTPALSMMREWCLSNAGLEARAIMLQAVNEPMLEMIRNVPIPASQEAALGAVAKKTIKLNARSSFHDLAVKSVSSSIQGMHKA
jgi:hypothetical protein